MNEGQKIRLGLIGAGNIGNIHLQEFGKLKDLCEFYGGYGRLFAAGA